MNRLRAEAAHANARRFAEQMKDETDTAVRAYLCNLAMSWHRIAEDEEFLGDSGEDHVVASPLVR